MSTLRPTLFSRDPRLTERGKPASRLDSLSDAVFGIAITLMIVTSANADSFSALVAFARTLPAFLLGIGFLLLIWKEFVEFSEVYGLRDGVTTALITVFLALVIFYVYPLRFLALFLTGLFFGLGQTVAISWLEVPDLMIYYGTFAAALYATLLLLHLRAWHVRHALALSPFETFYTRASLTKLGIMTGVPVISVTVVWLFRDHSPAAASIAGGCTYWLYSLLLFFWGRWYRKTALTFPLPDRQ